MNISINPTDLKRDLCLNIDFNSLLDTYYAPLPSTDLGILKDILLQIYLQPTIHALGPSNILVGAHNVRLGINGVDITASLVSEIGRELRAKSPDELRSEYAAGVGAWLTHLTNLHLLAPEISSDRRRFDFIVRQDIPAQFKQIGDRRVGWSGQLHLANFLYRFIKIRPISVIAAVKASQAQDGTAALPWAQQRELFLTVSQSLDARGQGTPAGLFPFGRIVLFLEMIYANPLADLLQQAIDKIELARRALEEQRVKYLLPALDEIQTLHQDFEKEINATANTLSQLNVAIGKL